MKKKVVKAVEQSVRQGVLAATWPRYLEYRMEEYADGDAWADAELPQGLRNDRWSNLSERQRSTILASDPLASGQGRLYSPLADAQDLFIEFASLEPTKEAWKSFLRRYGTLGPDPRRDLFSRFVEEVQRAKRVLKLYEAATAEPAHVKAIAGVWGEGTLQDPSRWAERTTPPEASRLALKEVDAVTRRMLAAETFSDLYYSSHGEQPLLSYGFRSLLGAMWLQFAFVRTSIREPRRCAAEDCPKLLAAGGEGKKRMYRNKSYCSKACGERQRDRDRRWSRTLSRSDDTA
jgi:hypothetical protein